MDKKAEHNHNDDSIRELSIQIPGRFADRLEAYAKQNDTEIAQVVIEAIDFFMRNQSKEGR